MSRFAIEIVAHGWMDGVVPELDVCSHGRVFVRVDGRAVVTPADGDFTLSAAAVRLLRTLDRDRSSTHPVDGLLPCCGNMLIAPGDGSSDVVIVGCPNGIDWSVTRSGPEVRLHDLHGSPELEPKRELDVVIPFDAYREAVQAFAREVASLFDGATKHLATVDDREGYAAFVDELRRRLDDGRPVGASW